MTSTVATFVWQIAENTTPKAGEAPQSLGSSLLSLFPMLIVMGVLIYFMWRGQKKEQKRRQEMVESVKVGDSIVTIGGIAGEVVAVKDDRFVIKTAESTKLEIVKSAVSAVPSKEEAPK